MTPLQARLVLRQLARVDELTRERIERARLYHEGLKDVPELLVAPLRTDFSHMYTYFPIQADDRNALLRHMMRSGRDVAGQHIKNCADFPAFRPGTAIVRTPARRRTPWCCCRPIRAIRCARSRRTCA